jgi:hypothetical protein
VSARLVAAKAALLDAQKAYEKVLREDYPINGRVRWDRLGTHSGIVLQHGYGGRLQVKNTNTGRTYWITGAHICFANDPAASPEGVAA